jgi:predicted phage terminase large subunit-like protein
LNKASRILTNPAEQTRYDNPTLLQRQPQYVAWLEGQDRETKEALLYGNWYVTKQQENYFKRAWCRLIQDVPPVIQSVRGFDLAGSIKDEVNKDPDYTATALLHKTKDGRYVIEHADHIRERFHTVEEWIFKLSETDADNVVYVIPVDAGAAGKAYASTLQKKLAESGRACRLFPMSNKSKLVRFRPFASVAQAGYIDILNSQWNTFYFDELEKFSGDGKTHDDMLDATVAGFWFLNQVRQLPSFTLPDLSQSTSFGFQSSALPTELTSPLQQGEFL